MGRWRVTYATVETGSGLRTGERGSVMVNLPKRRSVDVAISCTAASKAAWFFLEGLRIPLTLRTNCNAAAAISSCEACDLPRTLMLRHMGYN